MKELVWDSTLSVDVDEIDEDHRRLVDLFNILARSVEGGASYIYINAVLEELISCAIWHFRHEERLMLKYDYEDYEVHKAGHQKLIEGARMMQEKFQHEDREMLIDEIEFLEHWLTGHILGDDMELGEYLGKKM